jgi:F-type H+-transporting ATPase subunit delta
MSPENRVQAYASAFYEAAWERWLAAFAGVGDRLAQEPALVDRLQSGGDLAQRQRLLDGLLPRDVDAPVRNFLYTLLQRGELNLLPEIEADLRDRMVRATEQVVNVEIISAVSLTEQECQALQAKLERQFGTNLNIQYRVDPGILGGMIIRAGDKLIDGSVATRLADLRRAMGVTGRE